jgi:hypothetical protein
MWVVSQVAANMVVQARVATKYVASRHAAAHRVAGAWVFFDSVHIGQLGSDCGSGDHGTCFSCYCLDRGHVMWGVTSRVPHQHPSQFFLIMVHHLTYIHQAPAGSSLFVAEK